MQHNAHPPRPLDDIPGTTVFCARSAQKAYHLHRFCMSLMQDENRVAFRQDEEAYLTRFSMSSEQKQGVLSRNYSQMVAAGGNVYFLVKIAGTDGWSVQRAVSTMTDLNPEQFAQMMRSGGRHPDGWRTRQERS